jgi:hypothetical protein
VDPLATVPDLEARLGQTFADDELPRVEALLQDATDLVRLEVGDTIWTDPVTGVLLYASVPGSVRAIVLRAAERAIRNPGGFSSESSGDYTYQRNNVQGSGVYLTDAEIRLLRKAIRRTGLWTQPVTRGDVYPDVVFLEDSNGCELFPVDVYAEGSGRMTY